MDDTGALPDLHVLASRLLLYIIAEIDVGKKKNRLLRGNGIHIATALRDVHRMSLSAFTSTDVLM